MARRLHSLTQQAFTKELSRAKQRLETGDLMVRLTMNSFYPSDHIFPRGQVQQFSDWYQTTVTRPTTQLTALSYDHEELKIVVAERDADLFDRE